MCEDPVSDVDKSHIVEYVAPKGPKDSTPADTTDKAHVPNYVAPKGPKDPYEGGMDRSHVRSVYVSPEGPKDPNEGGMDTGHIKQLYVSPLPDPADEPPPDPAVVERERIAREVAEHAELVRRIQEEDRKRAAKSVEPTSIEGQD